jgi:hypothetical protein
VKVGHLPGDRKGVLAAAPLERFQHLTRGAESSRHRRHVSRSAGTAMQHGHERSRCSVLSNTDHACTLKCGLSMMPIRFPNGSATAKGLTKRSWIKISQIRTLSVDRIGSRLARASEEELARVVDGLTEIIA